MTEQKNSLRIVTILPPMSRQKGQAQLANGTQVLLSDGSELTGVKSVTLTAQAGGVWEATITVMPEIIHPITARAVIIEADLGPAGELPGGEQ